MSSTRSSVLSGRVGSFSSLPPAIWTVRSVGISWRGRDKLARPLPIWQGEAVEGEGARVER